MHNSRQSYTCCTYLCASARGRRPPTKYGQQAQPRKHCLLMSVATYFTYMRSITHTIQVGFYRSFGRPIGKVFLGAVFTYQIVYWGWVKLETDEIKEEKRSRFWPNFEKGCFADVRRRGNDWPGGSSSHSLYQRLSKDGKSHFCTSKMAQVTPIKDRCLSSLWGSECGRLS